MEFRQNGITLRDHLRGLVRDQLDLENFLEDSDGDFQFRYANITCLICFQDEDPSFVKIVSINNLPLHSYNVRISEVEAALNRVNHRKKGVKLSHPGKVGADNDLPIWATIDFMAPTTDSINGETLDRYLGMVRMGLLALAEDLLSKCQNSVARH